MNRTFVRTLSLLGLASASVPAFAHPGHGLLGWGAGLAHPFAVDHLLVMVAVGLWSAWALSARRSLLGPICFVGALLAGTTLALAGVSLPLVESGVALSVIAMGLLLSLALRAAPGLGLGVIACAGLLHGYAHGAELPAAAGVARYVAGFVLSTCVLHAAGWLAARGLNRWQAPLRQGLGLLMGLSGLALLLG